MHMTRILALVASLAFATLLHAEQPVSTTATPEQRVEALTQIQIETSTDTQSLGRLATLYQRSGDKERYRWTMARLTQLLPGLLKLKLDLVASYAADDMKTPAYDLLLSMKGQGFGVDISADPRFEKIHGTEVWDFAVASLKANMEPFGEGKVAYRLPAADLLIDALAWDPLRKQLLAGSARDGGIYRVAADGKLEPFIKADANNQLWSVYALAVDAPHKRLWVATTSVMHFKGYDADNAGKAALIEFDLTSGKLLHRYALERAGSNVFLSALALAPDGTAYAVDGVHKVVYTPREGKLEEVLANPNLNDIRAITVSGDGKMLYMVDTLLGIFGFDLEQKSAFGLGYNPDGLVLSGIVGLYWYDGTLVLVEPGMQPARVMRLTLSEDGRSVAKAMPLDVSRPEFTQLDGGTIAGDKLYFITNSQRAKYDRHGLLRDGAVLEPLTIWESDLRFAWDEDGVNLGMQPITAAKPAAKPPVTNDAKP